MTGRDRTIKVVIWRLISIAVTMTVLYVATGDVKSASGITFVLHGILLASHYAFELAWEKRLRKNISKTKRS